LGQTTYGSKISYSIAGITFQPSEFVKILFVFFVAGALYQSAGFFEVFTNGIRDITNGDYLSGPVRMIDSIMVFISIAAGVGVVLAIYNMVTGGVLI